MLLYKDIISGDELFSDAYPMTKKGDLLYEVDCALINIGVGDIDIGANASAEGGDEQVEDSVETKINLVHSMRLAETSFDKKSYMSYIKGYMKKILAHLEEESKEGKNPEAAAERLQIFKAKAPETIKEIVKNFKDYEFYVGEGMDPDGMVALLNYREDGVTPYFSFFMDGLKEEKL
ncbi:hypothetical protein GGF46_002681 [Coemansia sp. RSA 552]|nr:hypothetical protein GGF46_002681 [Coemansia sp. RSA 552]